MEDVGTSATYRGFRLQAMYALLEIFSQEREGYQYAPEDIEDLAIYDQQGNLVELIQVKSGKAPISLGDLGYQKPHGFFSRVSQVIDHGHSPKLKVIVFGSLGKEIQTINENCSQKIHVAAERISGSGFIEFDRAELILRSCDFIEVEEDDVLRQLSASLRSLDYALDIDLALNFLVWRLFRASENKERLTQAQVLEVIMAVGKFVSERSDRWNEWFVTIVPLQERTLGREIRQRLEEEFSAGVSVTFDHVLANLGIHRLDLSNSIESALSEGKVALLLGASGQGKSQAMYKYLYEKVPMVSRFVVRKFDGADQAIRISQALIAHAKSMGSPIHVGIEVLPSSAGWAEMLVELSSEPFVRVIACVRPEDWRLGSGDPLIGKYQTIPVELTEDEARVIFHQLAQIDDSVMSFEDAWERCGPNPPLLEFVHFCTQRVSLSERIRRQVYDLQQQSLRGLDSCVLEILEIVSAGAEAESQISMSSLSKEYGRQKVLAAVGKLEDEYLVRKGVGESALVTGLHPIRSSYVLQSLLPDQNWMQLIRKVLNCVIDDNLSQYILFQFDRGRISALEIETLITQHSVSSAYQIRSFLRALIWSSLYAYVEKQIPLLKEIYDDSNRSWMAVLDVDVAGVSPGGLPSVADFAGSDRRRALTDLKSKQRPKEEVYESAARWFASLNLQNLPISRSESSCIPEIGFWARRINQFDEYVSWLRTSGWATPSEPFRIDTDAYIVAAAFDTNDADIWRQVQPARHKMLESLQEAFPGTLIDGNDNLLTVGISLNPEDALNCEADPEFANSLIMMFVRVFRSLCPEYDEFDVVLSGESLGEQKSFAHKSIARNKLYPPWGVALNRAFLDFIERWFLPQTFQEFTHDVREKVHEYCTALSNTVAKAKKHYRKRPYDERLPLANLERIRLYNVEKELRRLPEFPNSGELIRPIHKAARFDSSHGRYGQRVNSTSYVGYTKDAYKSFLLAAEAVVDDLCNWFGLDNRRDEVFIVGSRDSIETRMSHLVETAQQLRMRWQEEIAGSDENSRSSPITSGNIRSMEMARDALVRLFAS